MVLIYFGGYEYTLEWIEALSYFTTICKIECSRHIAFISIGILILAIAQRFPFTLIDDADLWQTNERRHLPDLIISTQTNPLRNGAILLKLFA